MEPDGHRRAGTVRGVAVRRADRPDRHAHGDSHQPQRTSPGDGHSALGRCPPLAYRQPAGAGGLRPGPRRRPVRSRPAVPGHRPRSGPCAGQLRPVPGTQCSNGLRMEIARGHPPRRPADGQRARLARLPAVTGRRPVDQALRPNRGRLAYTARAPLKRGSSCPAPCSPPCC
ncbi:protein of unknown function [Ectopseudomonas oleovorans]|nr:protein of unknown function [Pseudomonas oleovorans]